MSEERAEYMTNKKRGEGEDTGQILLLLDNGETIKIIFPYKCIDEVYDTLGCAIKRGDVWLPGQFEGSADYMGWPLERIYTSRVIGEV